MKKPFVVDADGHVYENPDMFEKYLDAPYNQRPPKLVKDERDGYRWIIEGRLYPIAEGKGRGLPAGLRYGVARKGMFDGKERLADMDQEGIDVAVVFPSLGLSFNGIENKDLGVAIHRAYNNYLADYCSADPKRIKGAAALPLQDPPAAAEELKRCVRDLKMVGAFLAPHWMEKTLDSADYHPIYRAAEDLGVPILVHATTGTSVSPAAGAARFDNFWYTHLLSHPFEQMIAMACFMAGGILETFPNLKVAFLESGAGWLPFWLERMEEHYEEYPKWMIPNMKKSPLEYFRSQCFISCEPAEKVVPYVMSQWSDRVLYASDYHHFDSSFPNTVTKLLERDDLTPEQKEKILFRNANELFNFGIGL
ncbi:MAG: amidohydrolase family protein [Candidatus Binatia bacterium]